jgi:hypothetical protein
MDSAVAYYERTVTLPAFARLFADARTLPATHKRLGELAEERGNRATALEYYGTSSISGKRRTQSCRW